MNTSETIPSSWLSWQQKLSQSCCHTSLPIPPQSLNIRELFVSMLVVKAQSQTAGGFFCVPVCSQQNPHPKLWKTAPGFSQDTQKGRRWSIRMSAGRNGKMEQGFRSNSAERGKKLPQCILWSLGLSSALLQCHPSWKHLILFKLTSELLCMHWEWSETGIWKHTREHRYQSTKVPSTVPFNEH